MSGGVTLLGVESDVYLIAESTSIPRLGVCEVAGSASELRAVLSSVAKSVVSVSILTVEPLDGTRVDILPFVVVGKVTSPVAGLLE